MVVLATISGCGGGGSDEAGVPVSMSLSAVAVTPSEVQLSWSPDWTPDVFGYYVVRNGIRISGNVTFQSNEYADRYLQQDITYCYRVYLVHFPEGTAGQSNETCARTPRHASGWSITNAVNGEYPDIALDSTGGKHNVFRRTDGVHYAANLSGTWVDTLVDGNAGSDGQTAIALDNTGAVHIVYSGFGATTGLFHASNAGGAWTIEAVSGSAGFATALVIDAANNLHIAYGDESQYPLSRIRYASNSTGTWQTTPVSFSYSPGFRDVSLALDSTGVAHIAYALRSGLCAIGYAKNPGGVWVESSIDANAQCGVAMVLDGSDTPHIAYNRSMQIFHASFVGNVLNKEVVDTFSWVGGDFLSMTSDSAGRLHLSYQDQNADLKYAVNVNGAWRKSFVDKTRYGSQIALKVGVDGRSYILYGGANAGTLRLATSP